MTNSAGTCAFLGMTDVTMDSRHASTIYAGARRRLLTTINPAPARELNAYLLDNVTLFTPNEHEQIGLEDKGNVVTTLGKHGCYIRSLDVTFPAIDVAEVVDTTGAGDTFNGVLAAMMAQGNKLEYSVKMANLASSVEVTRKGAVTSIPTKDEVLAYVEKLT